VLTRLLPPPVGHPGVNTPDKFAELLDSGADVVRTIPESRFRADLHCAADGATTAHLSHTSRGAFLDESVDLKAMDTQPFGLSPVDAEVMDPQQRLLLETTWEAFEDAAIPVEGLAGERVGVFIGAFTLDHELMAVESAAGMRVSSTSKFDGIGRKMTCLSSRLSHVFDFRGPCFTVDTACSSSMVSMHLAVRSLAEGTSDVAVSGGVNVAQHPFIFQAMSRGGYLSSDGRCKTFEAAADGYGRGEAAAVVVLKRLDDAIRDGDQVYAVIRGSAVNQDGRTESMPMPSGEAQATLAREVLAASGVDRNEVAYVEAHGTGTKVGDPTETKALLDVYGSENRPVLLIGSAKSNVNHCEAAAGVTGIVKCALSIRRGELLPQKRVQLPNPQVDWTRLQVVDKAIKWPSSRRLCAINSFGYVVAVISCLCLCLSRN
jgi:acyl transferase domain-containing protein